MMDLYIAVRTDHDSDETEVAYVETSEEGMRRLLSTEGYEVRDGLSYDDSAVWEDDVNRTLYVEHWTPSIDGPAGFKWVENLGPEGE